MAIRPMRAEDRAPVLDLLESAFHKRMEFELYMDFDPLFDPADFLLDVEDGRPVSCVQVFEKRIRLGGSEVLLGGIGSVATAPDRRERGLAAELMRRQTDAMRERGMSLGLLFAGPREFYEKLGWHALPLRQALLQRAPDARTCAGRRFEPGDLPRVAAVYDAYSEGVDGTTLRDETYWRGQLRYAGTPDEDFRVLEQDGEIVAYARATHLGSLACALEYACTLGNAGYLARLLAGLCPEQGVLVARLAPDPELEAALEEAGIESKPLPDPSPMWRVLDRARLAGLVDLPADTDDGALLRALHEGPLHYWLSDRF
jgi:predicted N-acetyltransferase YhbS